MISKYHLEGISREEGGGIKKMYELNHENKKLQACFKEYLSARNLSSRTVEEYPKDIEPFLTYIQSQEVENIRSVTIGHIQGYHSLLMERTYRGKQLSVRTIQSRLSQVKSFFRFLHKTSKVYFDPACNYELPKRGKRLPKNIITIPEAIKLLDKPDLSTLLGIRDKAIMELLYSSGIRSTELRKMELGDMNQEDQTIYIIGKGDVEAIVPYGSEAKRALEHYLLFSRSKLLKSYKGGRPLSSKRLKEEQGKEYIFLSRNGYGLTQANLYLIIRRYADVVSIEHKVGPHSLRHSCATHLLKNGAGIRQIQQLLRHKDINTTQMYTHVDIEDLKTAQAKYHPRERPRDE
jgi:integrase/recombinase XerD